MFREREDVGISQNIKGTDRVIFVEEQASAFISIERLDRRVLMVSTSQESALMGVFGLVCLKGAASLSLHCWPHQPRSMGRRSGIARPSWASRVTTFLCVPVVRPKHVLWKSYLNGRRNSSEFTITVERRTKRRRLVLELGSCAQETSTDSHSFIDLKGMRVARA
jgi:hypothetical protein